MVSRAMGSTSMFIQATKERGNNRRRRRKITVGKADMSRLDMAKAMAETARRWFKNSLSDFTIE